MTIRWHQLDSLPPPIEDNPVEEERMRVLRILAQRLPDIAARSQIRIVGKGGTLLRLCEGTPRPSTDYDCDTNTRWPDAAQARAIRQALRDVPNVRELNIVEPSTRTQPVRFNWQARLRDGSTATLSSFINTKITPELDEPEFRAKHLRVQDGINTYTPERLYQGKTDAFRGRAASRDLYDIWYGLSHHIDRIAPATRIELDDHTTRNLTAEQLADWNEDLAQDQVLSGNVTVDDMLTGIMECLEKDPIVALNANPERGLYFLVETTRRTISLGLKPAGDEPFLALYTRPQANADDVAAFTLACKAPVWDAMGITPPSEGKGAQHKLLTEIISENIDRQNALGLARGRTP